MTLAEAINRVREYAEARALELNEQRGQVVDSVFLLQAAAYTLAQACGVAERAELAPAEDATWDCVAKAIKGSMVKGGES